MPLQSLGAALILLGLPLFVITFSSAIRFMYQCITAGRFQSASSFPLVGGLLTSVGLWLAFATLPLWLTVLPLAVELVAFVASFVVAHATRAERA
jgi:hypothetical protein